MDGTEVIMAQLAQDMAVQPQIIEQHEAFGRMYDAGLAAAQMRENTWRRPRFFHMTQMLGLTRGLPGATAELGAYRGLASYLICRCLRDDDGSFDGTGHHIMDSFQGLPQPDDIDGADARAGVFGDTSVEHVRETLRAFPGVNIIEGWIPEALAFLPEQTYRFVHIDVDLHEPTLACLEYFHARMVPGGVIVVDDYGPWPTGEWPGCRRAVEAFCARRDVPFAAMDTGNVVIVKR